MAPPKMALADRLWRHVSRGAPDECWPWLKAVSRSGHGIMSFQYGAFKTSRPPHVIAWELTNGPVPVGLCVLHHCDNPPCCNPGHLWLGTKADNSADCAAKGRTARGSRHPGAILTEKDIGPIRSLLATGESERAVGERFGVSRSAIADVKHGRHWTHVRNE